jgi:hypothetical protein
MTFWPWLAKLEAMDTTHFQPTQREIEAVRRLIWDAHITAAMYALWRDDMREIEYIEHFGEEPCSE